MPAGTKVELKSMEEQLQLLLDNYNFLGDKRLSEIEVPESAWLCHTKKLFCDTEVLVDSLLMPAECSEPAANPGVFENTSSPEIADTKIKNITERGLLQMRLLFKEGEELRALYKQEEDTELVGFDGPRDELIKMLAEGDDRSENRLKKVFITGMPGSGKTTLARVVYNQLKPQFDCGAFITVRRILDSENGQPNAALLWEMLSQLDVENHKNVKKKEMNHQRLLDQVKQFLQNNRYFVVVDDVCNTDVFNDHVLPTFAYGVHGSRVIGICGIDCVPTFGLSLWDWPVYKMKSLGYLDSRKLFLKQFFVCEACCPNAATDVLNEILKMCGGSPSAIISIAVVLATRVTATEPWEEMLNSVYSSWKQMASLVDSEYDYSLDCSELTQILLLPYSHLPSDLKYCLMLFAVQPKTQMIHRPRMIRKWMGEGIVNYGRLSFEESANRYFDELIEKNCIQLVEYGNYLGEEIYEVNHMMHNVLRWLAQEERFATICSDGGTSREYAQPIRLSIQCSGSALSVYTSKMHQSIISLTIVGPVKFYVDCHLARLRLLDLDGCKDMDNSAMAHICRMTYLKYLSLKHTQITEILPEIGALRDCLETLDISQTEISNLPPEIGNLILLETLYANRTQISSLPREIAGLQRLKTLDISRSKIRNLQPEIWELEKLKTLDASRTQINFVPREIAELRNLETLDVRQTQVKELPKELFELPKLANLYYGESSSLRGVKLPLGIEQSESVEELHTVDSREWSGSAMEENVKFVWELEVVLHDQPTDKDQNVKLLSSIGKCENLVYLRIHGDYNPSDDVIPAAANFPLLERLKVVGRFVKVPRWFAQLSTLKKLDVRVCKLDQDDLKILGALQGLSTLALALICIPRKKEVVITNWLKSSTATDVSPAEETSPAGFMSLEDFRFDCHVPWITFEPGAMPLLKRLHLKLYACPANKFPSGLINLSSLEVITLEYPSEYASSNGIAKVVAVMRKEASNHRNVICLLVNWYPEVFLPNTGVDKTITGTEIKEASNQGNRIELSVEGDHEVLLSNTRVETITTAETEETSNCGNQMELSVDGDREVLLSNTRVDETIAGSEIKECY